MRNISILIALLFLLACSSESKTDKSLLEKDKKDLSESMDSYKVLMYKFGKIAFRSSALDAPPSPELEAFNARLENVNNKLMKGDSMDMSGLGAMDYIQIYNDFRAMKAFLEQTDEDEFPTLSQAMEKKEALKEGRKLKIKSKEQKIYEQNLEHAFLSAVVLFSRDLGKEIALYESYKTQPNLLPEREERALMQFFRGFLFFDKGLYYLSEDEFSKNIRWLEAHPDQELPYTQVLFAWSGDKGNGYTGFHAFNYLFRGFDRLMMDREIDEERALKDFEVFLADSKKMGLENEAIWAIESYLYLKYEDHEKAINSLTKLKQSDLISSRERKSIDESIAYLKDRETGKVLNGVYDKYFLSKVVSKYMFAVLAKVDWRKTMEAQKIPYTKELFKTVDSFKYFLEKMESYTSAEKWKDAGKGLQEKGSDLWEKAKEGLNQ